jgi:hypothetical protein
MNDVAKILLTGAIGFIGGILTRWPLEKFAERRAFVRSISDRYIELAQKPEDEPSTKSWNTKDEFWRIGTLQDLGAGALRPFEFRRVCDRIASRGLEDPRQREIYVFEDDRRDLLTLLRWGESISLHNVERLMRRTRKTNRPSHKLFPCFPRVWQLTAGARNQTGTIPARCL